jgi:hypothetical protein
MTTTSVTVSRATTGTGTSLLPATVVALLIVRQGSCPIGSFSWLGHRRPGHEAFR